MNKLSAGFARADITPMRGIELAGYFVKREATGVLDTLNTSALALKAGEKTVIMMSIDLLKLPTSVASGYRKTISKATGLPESALFLHCTHTHTAPYVLMNNSEEIVTAGDESGCELVDEYRTFLEKRLTDTALAAIEDMSPARIGFCKGTAKGVSFLRRYRMKDGSVRTNPGINNPDIVSSFGEPDSDVNIVRFDRENDSIALVNFPNHPDVIGGTLISADWPGFLAATLEKTLDNTKCIFFNGAEGDVNHVNVMPSKGFMNDLAVDFDDVPRGYGHSRFIGRAIAGAVLQVWDKAEYCDCESIDSIESTIDIPSNMPHPSEIPEAEKIKAFHDAGRENELPYKGMMLTTMLADASRKLRLQNGPEAFKMSFAAVRIGKIAFVGIPGEPFSEIGNQLKATEGYDMIIPCCLVNGCDGYFPMKDSFDEGGYEAKSSIFKAGVGELIVKEGKSLLGSLKK